MPATPQFFQSYKKITSQEVFKPSPAARRTEGLAWLGAGIVAASVLYVLVNTGEISFFVLLFLLLVLMMAAAITFGNWVDRNTAIEIDPSAVRYHSPIRDAAFNFDQIQSLWAIPAAAGWRIIVQGSKRYFQFRTLGILKRAGQESLRVGIEGGERLAGLIRSQAGLSAPVEEGDAWVCRRA